VEGGEPEIESVKRKIAEKGMNWVEEERFLHLRGRNDKGKAIKIVKKLYEVRCRSVLTAGIAGSANDLSMLLAVDYPIFLSKRFGLVPYLRDLTTIDGTGSRAWNDAIIQLIKRLEYEGIEPQ